MNWHVYCKTCRRLRNKSYRARKHGALHIPYTAEQLVERLSMFPACWICGGPKEAVDHVIPLAKGGAEVLANFRPICTACNSGKGSRDHRGEEFEKWVRLRRSVRSRVNLP